MAVTTTVSPVLSTKSFLLARVVADLYTRHKLLQRQLGFVDIQEEYIKLLRAQEEVKRIQSVHLVTGQFIEYNNGIVGSTTWSNYYVRILMMINRDPASEAVVIGTECVG